MEMKTKNIIKGLQTLLPYYDDIGGFHNGAEHDVIYAYETDRPLNSNDLSIMIALGWHQEHDGRNYNEAFVVSDYRQNETWHCYL